MTETAEKRRRLGGREATAAHMPGAHAISVGDTGAPLPEGWKRYLLSDLARMESGHTPSRRHPEYWGGNIPWIGIRDATGNHGRTIYETNENTNALGIANSASRVLPKETVCLSRTASVGYVVVMGREMATSQDFANWICGPDLDYRYLKYALIAEGDALLNFASGSVHQTIYFPELKSFHIAAPEKPEQGAIADILSALDDKIELNRQTNETLEGMAQAIFRDWFVDFGPTRRKVAGEADPLAIMGGLTPDPARVAELAALFPAALGDDGLPVGWMAGTLDRLALVNPESWKTKNHPAQVEYVDLSNTKWGTIEATAILTWEAAPSRARRVVRTGDTIVGTVRPGNGSYAYIGRDGYTASTGFAVLRPKQAIYTDAIYVAATAADNITRLANLADGHGGAYPAVNPDVVVATCFPVVPDDLLAAFSVFASPLRAKVEQAKLESQTLAEARDYLLPRLMSGAVRVAPKVEAA